MFWHAVLVICAVVGEVSLIMAWIYFWSKKYLVDDWPLPVCACMAYGVPIPLTLVLVHCLGRQ